MAFRLLLGQRLAGTRSQEKSYQLPARNPIQTIFPISKNVGCFWFLLCWNCVGVVVSCGVVVGVWKEILVVVVVGCTTFFCSCWYCFFMHEGDGQMLTTDCIME